MLGGDYSGMHKDQLLYMSKSVNPSNPDAQESERISIGEENVEDLILKKELKQTKDKSIENQ